MNRKMKKIFKKLDKLCEGKEHDNFELFDGIFQCKRCHRVINKNTKKGGI